MKKKGVIKIIQLVAKVILITSLLFIIKQVCAQELTPEAITTTFPEMPPTYLEEIKRFYDISERSLEIGYNETLETTSLFQITVNNQARYLIINNFSQDHLNLIFIGKGKTLFNQKLTPNNYVIFKIEDLNLKVILHSVNKTHAQMEFKLFRQEIPIDVDYFELFDIQVRLAQHEIYSPTSLTAMIEFTNFGEGPSHVRLIYSIIDTKGKEFYTGIEEKIIETDQVMIKNFNNLNIPFGEYTIKTTIYYGDNQEATSEESFTLKPVPKSQIIKQPAIFITIILLSFIAVVTLRKKQTQDLQNK